LLRNREIFVGGAKPMLMHRADCEIVLPASAWSTAERALIGEFKFISANLRRASARRLLSATDLERLLEWSELSMNNGCWIAAWEDYSKFEE
jgi:hypothetical protein